GFSVSVEEVMAVIQQIQKMDPPGIAATDLRECLLLQLERKSNKIPGRDIAIRIIRDEWESFEKKHFDKVLKKLNISDEDLKTAYECILLLDPKPGLTSESPSSKEYIVPDFEVYYNPGKEDDDQGDFVITLNKKNLPALRISPSYKKLWDDLNQKKSKCSEVKEKKTLIESKMKSAKAFRDAL